MMGGTHDSISPRTRKNAGDLVPFHTQAQASAKEATRPHSKMTAVYRPTRGVNPSRKWTSAARSKCLLFKPLADGGPAS